MKAIPFLASALAMGLAGTANAQDVSTWNSRIPESCRDAKEGLLLKHILVDEEMIRNADDAKREIDSDGLGVTYTIVYSSRGFEKTKACLEEMFGFKVAEELSPETVTDYGVAARTGPNCLGELNGYRYPRGDTDTLSVEAHEITVDPKRCVSFFHYHKQDPKNPQAYPEIEGPKEPFDIEIFRDGDTTKKPYIIRVDPKRLKHPFPEI
jgi:hypothetical protein